MGCAHDQRRGGAGVRQPRGGDAVSAPLTPRLDLGPNQLKWLRKNVSHFAKAKEEADKALADTEAKRREMPAPEESRT